MSDWFSDDHATFGDRLAHAREAAGMTQAELARRLGVGARSVAAWEDDRAEPRANRVQMIAGLLNVSLMWLLSGRGDGLDGPAPETTAGPDEIASALVDLGLLRAELGRMVDRVALTERRLRRIARDEAA